MAESNETSHDERTEPATPFRREEFRKQGKVALSKELTAVVLMCAGGLSLFLVSQGVLRESGLLAQRFFDSSQLFELGGEQVTQLGRFALTSAFNMTLPLFAVAMVVGIGVCAAQVGFHVTWEPLSPNLDRLDPIKGFQRLFSLQGTLTAVKALLKMAIVGAVAWVVLRGEWEGMGNYFQMEVGEGTLTMLHFLSRLFFTCLISLSAFAILDYGYQRFNLEKQMRMTRREAKDEFKLREGDPLIKSRIKTIQRKMARRRMMEAVPKADVVVTNPTHFAVALQYDTQSMEAPKVTAKGAGHVALKIKELARFHQVPIVENKPLARTLYKEIEIGKTIPRELYRAVSEVLAYVYRLKAHRGVLL